MTTHLAVWYNREMKLQSYSTGEIHRIRNEYSYVVKGETVGTYKSVDALVKANPVEKTSKKEAKTSDDKKA